MKEITIGFIGLGLIGGSIAKALRRVSPDIRMIAYNRSRESLVAALADGTINEATDQIDSSFAKCDFVILCMPVSANIACLPLLKDLLPPSCLITDVGSVKSSIREAARDLDMEDRFLGGHPMTGAERTGYAYSTDRLLENAYYLITPSEATPAGQLKRLEELISMTGAVPVVIDVTEHDRIMAAISHLPHVIAFSLVNLVKDSDTGEGMMRRLAAGGFRDITRIASSSADMWESICLENSGPLLEAMDAYSASLQEVGRAIRAGRGQQIHNFFQDARDYREDMPSRMKGSILPAHEIYADIIDESGAIATIATILASNNINIKNVGIIHNREYEEGVLRISFYDADAAEKAAALLTKFSYNIHRR